MKTKQTERNHSSAPNPRAQQALLGVQAPSPAQLLISILFHAGLSN